MTRRMSDTVRVTIPFTETDIGGTNSSGSDDALHWVSMAEFRSFMCLVKLGAWDATDDLDTCKLEQATSSAGAGKKDLTTSGSALNYDTANPVDAAGDTVILQCQADDLDVSNGFAFVRVYLAEADNTGVDNVSAVYVQIDPRNASSVLQGAAVVGSLVYVDVNS